MVYFTTKTEALLHGAVMLRVQAREVDEEGLAGSGVLLAEATLIMDPRRGSVLGSAIIEARRFAPAEVVEELRRRAAQEAADWAA